MTNSSNSQEFGYCFQGGTTLDTGWAYMFRLELLFANGFWVMSRDAEYSATNLLPENMSYYDGLIACPSRFQAEG